MIRQPGKDDKGAQWEACSERPSLTSVDGDAVREEASTGSPGELERRTTRGAGQTVLMTCWACPSFYPLP